MRRRALRALRDTAGITVHEIMIGMTLIAIGAALAAGSYSEYRESVSTTRAAEIISADVGLARSLAIRNRDNVSLVANETSRSYVLRNNAGNVLHQRAFNVTSEISLTALNVATTGDSLTFDSRGLLVGAGNPQISATRQGKVRTVTLSPLGRTQVN